MDADVKRPLKTNEAHPVPSLPSLLSFHGQNYAELKASCSSCLQALAPGLFSDICMVCSFNSHLFSSSLCLPPSLCLVSNGLSAPFPLRHTLFDFLFLFWWNWSNSVTFLRTVWWSVNFRWNTFSYVCRGNSVGHDRVFIQRWFIPQLKIQLSQMRRVNYLHLSGPDIIFILPTRDSHVACGLVLMFTGLVKYYSLFNPWQLTHNSL